MHNPRIKHLDAHCSTQFKGLFLCDVHHPGHPGIQHILIQNGSPIHPDTSGHLLSLQPTQPKPICFLKVVLLRLKMLYLAIISLMECFNQFHAPAHLDTCNLFRFHGFREFTINVLTRDCHAASINVSTVFYRLQGKVMFSEASVCSQGRKGVWTDPLSRQNWGATAVGRPPPGKLPVGRPPVGRPAQY